MKILITGGTGLIGSGLYRKLLQNGNEVIILSRRSGSGNGLVDGVEVVQWDGKTPHGLVDVLSGVNAVVNLAGENLAGPGFFPTRWTEERKRVIRESRLNVGRALVEALSKTQTRPEVLIQASAIGLYGTQKDEALDEFSLPGDDFLARLCQEWETSTRPVTNMGIRHVVIRIGVVLASNSGALARMLLPFKFFVGGPFGNGKQVISWVHLEDVVDAIQYLINTPSADGVYNLTAPNPVSNAELGKEIARTLHRPYWLPVPGFLMKLMFGEVSSIVLEGQKVIPKRLLESGYNFRYKDITTAIQDLLR
jgi:uncharacterized protein (TIGR01777 family)